MSQKKLSLELGDIIQIIAPSNVDLHEIIFYITYLDDNKILMLHSSKNETITLNLIDESLTDKSIESIIILNRSKEKGFARQHNLLPGEWISIYFSGEFPFVINGKINNLEEDRIEIETYPEKKIIFIDFEYKGIPETLAIEKIILHNKPLEKDNESKIFVDDNTLKGADLESKPLENESLLPDQPLENNITVDYNSQLLKEEILSGDQIIFGENLGEISQIVEVNETEKRFGITNQTNDLLDELLAKIPNNKRNKTTLTKIHLLIERYKQLRNEFSIFDSHNNITNISKKGDNNKPIANHLQNLNKRIEWILPIAKNIKNIYDAEEEETEDNNNITNLTLANERINETEINEHYNLNDIPDDQNKYIYLLQKSHEIYTPFKNPIKFDTQLILKEINCDLTAIIENIDDYTNYVFNDGINKKRFYLENYITAPTKLEINEIEQNIFESNLIKIGENDKISIKSFLVLPEKVISHSKLYLPKTNILTKANLNLKPLSYWEFLNTNTNVNVETINNIDEEYNHDDANLFKNITEFICNEMIEDEGKYNKFIQSLIPNTKRLINLIKSNSKNKYIMNFIKYINLLEPFYIYENDITISQYEEIKTYIQNKIDEYKKTLSENNKKMNIIKEYYYGDGPHVSNMLKTIKNEASAEIIKEKYKINAFLNKNNRGIDLFDGSPEIIRKIMLFDNGNLFMNSISKENIDLISGLNITELLSNQKKESNQKEGDEFKKNQCGTKILSKKYLSNEELIDDNNKDTYFDKEFDNTNYKIIKSYEKELATMELEEFKRFLHQSLIKYKYKEDEIPSLIETLLEGRKRVEENMYAIVEIQKSNENEYKYYKRINNKWELDETIQTKTFDSSFFCNLDTKCFKIANNCVSKEVGNAIINKNNMELLLNNFEDETIQLTNEELKLYIEEYNKEYISQAEKLTRFKHLEFVKNDLKKLKYISTIDDSIIQSPFLQLRDIILNLPDFAEKQHNIQRFCISFSREASESDPNQYWRYCNVTNVKLIPSFYLKLAIAFFNDNYNEVADELCNNSNIGTKSDDGNAWVDKNSGHIIKMIEFNDEEGYEESGFKKVSHDVLDINFTIKSGQKLDDESQKIFNIINTFQEFLGINTNLDNEFIIKNTMLKLYNILPIKEQYELKAEKILREQSKKLPSYNDTKNNTMLLLTIGYLLIAIQTSIPSIKTKKTFPGCIRSFTGFPLEGIEDYSGLNYIICIANKIKSSVEPWNTIQKTNITTLTKKVKDYINKYIIKDPVVSNKIDAKKTYIQLEQPDFIPEEYNIKNWVTFLPPLNNYKINIQQNVTSEFTGALNTHMTSGTTKILEDFEILKSKYFYFSLSLIKIISTIIKKKDPILTNASLEPFIENACCNENNEYNSLYYFEKKNAEITNYKKYCKTINIHVNNIKNLFIANILFNKTNTRHIYPILNLSFNEELIYKAFIKYCRFNTHIPIPLDLQPLCLTKPESFNKYDSIDKQIDTLKAQGKIFDNTALQKLLQNINFKNKVINNYITSKSLDPSNIEKLRSMIEPLRDNDYYFPKEFSILYYAILDRINFSIDNTQTIGKISSFKDYLVEQNIKMLYNIKNFIQKNSKLNKRKFAINVELLTNIIEFSNETKDGYYKSKDKGIFKILSFIKNILHDIINIYPNMIINNNYYNKQYIPRHWKLSNKHVMDIQSIIIENYKTLSLFYDNKNLKTYLMSISDKLKYNYLFAEYTKYLIPFDNKQEKSIFDDELCSYLLKFYFYNTLQIYIENINEPYQESFMGSTNKGIDSELVEFEPAQNLLEDVNIKDKSVISSLLIEYLSIISIQKNYLNLNYNQIMDKILRSKEKEKEGFTKFLKDLTDEEREIENTKKNLKLGDWSIGLQKGLTQYVKETYDQEREIIDNAVNDFSSIYKSQEQGEHALDLIQEESEINDISHLGDDDDHGNNDGDL